MFYFLVHTGSCGEVLTGRGDECGAAEEGFVEGRHAQLMSSQSDVCPGALMYSPGCLRVTLEKQKLVCPHTLKNSHATRATSPLRGNKPRVRRNLTASGETSVSRKDRNFPLPARELMAMFTIPRAFAQNVISTRMVSCGEWKEGD